jgi:predicted HAD superfamily Cof-like phosphohydrolase
MERQLLQVMDFQMAFNVSMPDNPKMLSKKRTALRNALLQEEVDELKSAKNIIDVSDALMDILYIVYGSIHEYGLADRAVMMFDEVHRSNMSKMDENGKPIFREDGKVMKPETFSPPNLKKILERDFTMYKKNDVLGDIAEMVRKETEKKIQQKIKENLNIIDKFLLWVSDTTEKYLRKKVVVKHPQTSLGNTIVSVYGKDYVI